MFFRHPLEALSKIRDKLVRKKKQSENMENEEDPENKFVTTYIFDLNGNFEFTGEIIAKHHKYSSLDFKPVGLEGIVSISRSPGSNSVNGMRLPNTDDLTVLENLKIGRKYPHEKNYLSYFLQNDKPSKSPFSYVQFNFLESRFSGRSHKGIGSTPHPKKSPPILYYEITVVQVSRFLEDTCISIGLAPPGYEDTESMVGWRRNSVGYHLDNGGIYDNFVNLTRSKKSYLCEKYTQGDVIGVGWDMNSGEVFFTRNGKIQAKKTKRHPRYKFRNGEYYPISQNEIDIPKPSIATYTVDDNVKIIFSLNRGVDVVKYPFCYQRFNIFPDLKPTVEYHDMRVICQ